MHRYLLRSAACMAMMAVNWNAASIGAPALIDGRFDIGGRSIRLLCRGDNGPSVVIDAGMGTAPVEDQGWRRIADKVSAEARVCLYDRAGLGGSDPAPGTKHTSADSSADLEKALRVAGVKPPFLLVGHSVGGLNAQVFASRYPSDVAGLVLISSTHADQMRIWRGLLPPARKDDPKALIDTREFLSTMEYDPSRNPEKLDVLASERQARRLTSLGDKPVIILTHSPKYRMAPGLDEPLAITLEDATQRLQKQFLTLSSHATQRIAPNAGHGLPHEAPDFVVSGILEGVAAVRKRSATAR